MRNQKVELEKLEVGSDFAEKSLECSTNLQKSDRIFMDKANGAFVFYIQAYNKHECNSVLRLKDLELGEVAMDYGLLKMPRMPKLKGRDLSSFKECEIYFTFYIILF